MTMERAQQLNILWSYRWWLLAFSVAAALVAFAVAVARPSVYQADALGQIVSSRQADGDILSQDELLSLSNVYVELASTNTVLDLAHADASVGGDNSDEFDSSVEVEPQERVGVLSFSAEDEDPKTAADWANAYATAFAQYADDLQGTQRNTTLDRIQARIDEITQEIEDRGLAASNPAAAGLQAERSALQDQAAVETAAPGDSVRVIEQAVAPSSPIAPNPLRDALLAFIGALAIGAVAAYVREAVADRYGSSDEAAEDLSLTILAEIPQAGGDVSVLEPFRRLRTAVVVALGNESQSHGILVTGAEPSSGKSFIAANLARTLAAEGWKVVAIDGDLRRPTLHNQLGTRRQPGLGDLIAGGSDRLDVKRVLSSAKSSGESAGDLRVLSAGAYIEDSVERLSSRRMAAIVEELRSESDFVVFDSPPTLAVVDPVVLARYSDGVVLVIDARKTRRRDARKAIQTMRAIGTPVLGIVYNRSSRSNSGYYSYDPLPVEPSQAKPKFTARAQPNAQAQPKAKAQGGGRGVAR